MLTLLGHLDYICIPKCTELLRFEKEKIPKPFQEKVFLQLTNLQCWIMFYSDINVMEVFIVVIKLLCYIFMQHSSWLLIVAPNLPESIIKVSDCVWMVHQCK